MQLRALTALRFPLALWVAAYHLCRPWLQQEGGGLLRNLLAAAPAAVSTFFVLSGFVLTVTYGHRLELRRYLRARAARILPIYWLAVALVVPLGLAARARGLVEDPHPLRSLALVGLGLQAWMPDAALRWNAALWSVSVELFLYACLPLLLRIPMLLRIPTRAGGRRSLWWALVLALMALLPSLAWVVLQPDGALPGRFDDVGTWLHVVRFNPALRLFEFAAGICAARAFQAGVRVPWPVLIGVTGAAALLLASGALPPVVVACGATSWISVLWVLGLAGVSNGPLLSPVAVRLGEASYCLYALHLPVMFWLLALSHRQASTFSPGFALLALGLALGVALAAHRLVEEPVRRAWGPSRAG